MSSGPGDGEESYELQPRQPSLMRFMQNWTAMTLDSETRSEFMGIFDRLTKIVYADHQTQSRQSQLCHDGTPLELSIAINSSAQIGQRFVCDIAGGIDDDPALALEDQLRDAAEHAVPQFAGRTAQLDRLFERHLAGRLRESRFLVWYGAGAARGKSVLGKLYFNTEWLDQNQVGSILASLVPPSMIDTIALLPDRAKSYYKCFAYDFDRSGLRNIKFYLQPGELSLDELFALFEAFPEAGQGRLRDFFATCFDTDGLERKCPFAMVLGLKQGGEGFVFEPKIYAHLPSLGHETMTSMAPLMQRVFTRWGFPAIDFTPRGSADFEPTLAGLAVSGVQEGIALYFKPART